MEFIGKFHPLIVHLPIGLIIAAFGLELLFLKKDNPNALRSIRFLLGLGSITAIISAILGYFLSMDGGYDDRLIFIHQWFGIGFAVCASIFYVTRKIYKHKIVLWSGWFVVLLVLTIAGHFGGSLTHGENYLIESSPGFVKKLFSYEQKKQLNKPLDSAVVFEDIIQPIIKQKCGNCHNNRKKQGGLNLQTVAGWEKGGKNGQLFKLEEVMESLILERIYLPVKEKGHMPPSGKPQLASAEVALLEWWIEQGGNYQIKVSSLEKNRRINKILQPEFTEKNIYDQILAPAFDQNALRRLQSEGLRILPAARGSTFLEISFSGDTIVNQNQLKSLLKLSDNITRIDFSFSGVTDEQLELLDQFINLIHVSLANIVISDKGVSHLNNLENLQYLNLHSTNISDDCLADIGEISSLKKVFFWNTNISADALEKLAKNRPDMKLEN